VRGRYSRPDEQLEFLKTIKNAGFFSHPHPTYSRTAETKTFLITTTDYALFEPIADNKNSFHLPFVHTRVVGSQKP
jgi:hypothetical protein